MHNSETLDQLQNPIRDLRNRFVTLTETLRPSLWRYCLRLTGSPWDAEDLVQETMLKAFARLGYLGQALNVKAYLFRIASNTWIDQWRRPRLDSDNSIEAADLASTPNIAEKLEVQEALELLAATLPPRQRVVLLLIDVFDFTPSEVAVMMETTQGAVKSALHRARSSLRGRQIDRATSRDLARTNLPPSDPLLKRFIDAFNKRDPEALLALVNPEATNEIVGDWEELGTEMMRQSSMKYWSEEKAIAWAEYGVFHGQPVFFGFRKTDGHEKVLAEIILPTVGDDRIISMKWYYFNPELISNAASLLGVPVETHGYQFVFPDDSADHDA